ncbi:class I SAM-dependent methyltransferase [Xenorhabdus littoralis]|uniref:class I SAM-dependent methyltransferase n=1 Tax=Xenorhabdus littoralis TaxID=2582835 RepID=UPI0029E7CD99|nr:class I SAM-dependent methyltransferase [Xenorhabdus sp. psl]MDX7993232.1 class I SAM-dependent methyltransferase [Xenorhabdus sp. psl]
MKDLFVDLTPEQYENFAIVGTSIWNSYLKDRILEEMMNINSGKNKLLDVGMGTGHILFDLLDFPEFDNYHLNGIDLDFRMVDFCNEKIKKHSVQSRITVYKGSASALPFQHNMFSLIYGRSVIHHWSNPQKGLQEICRVLDKGGIAIIHEPLSDADEDAIKLFNKEREKCGISNMSTEEKYTLDGIQSLLFSCQMKDVEYHVQKGTGIGALGCEILLKKKV